MSWNIVITQSESAEPKANGGHHIFTNTECCNSIRRGKVHAFIHRIISLLKPQGFTKKGLMTRKGISTHIQFLLQINWHLLHFTKFYLSVESPFTVIHKKWRGPLVLSEVSPYLNQRQEDRAKRRGFFYPLIFRKLGIFG